MTNLSMCVEFSHTLDHVLIRLDSRAYSLMESPTRGTDLGRKAVERSYRVRMISPVSRILGFNKALGTLSCSESV